MIISILQLWKEFERRRNWPRISQRLGSPEFPGPGLPCARLSEKYELLSGRDFTGLDETIKEWRFIHPVSDFGPGLPPGTWPQMKHLGGESVARMNAAEGLRRPCAARTRRSSADHLKKGLRKEPAEGLRERNSLLGGKGQRWHGGWGSGGEGPSPWL